MLPRVLARDYTVFGTDPTEIADRLNWLIAPQSTDVDALLAIAAEQRRNGINQVVVCGMGGSSLYARTLVPYADPTYPQTIVIDTTDPAALRRIDAQIDYAHSAFLFASKSGSTIETAAHQAYFTAQIDRTGTDPTDRIVVITDPGSPFARHATANGWRHLLLADPNVGGRFSAHTVFGVTAAAFSGIDVAAHLDAAAQTYVQLASLSDNSAVIIAAHLALIATSNARIPTLRVASSNPNDPLKLWIEQLIAESLGKQGRGIHVLTATSRFQPDRTLRVMYDETSDAAALTVDQSVLTLTVPSGHRGVATAASVLMLATALAGRGLGVNPFDQPDVAAAKRATAAALDNRTQLEAPQLPAALLAQASPSAALVVLAYVDPDSDEADQIVADATRIGEQRDVPMSLGFGPRYLHSTGQLHKGALRDACYAVIAPDTAVTLEIPGYAYGFGELIGAQAAGDIATLRARGRTVGVITASDLHAFAQHA